MRTNLFRNSIFRIPVTIAGVLLFGAAAAFGQQQVNLTAAPTTTTLPDGSTVPMWGYSCGAAATGSLATCAALDTKAPLGTWSPVLITVPTGQALQINLTNNLSFLPPGGGAANNIPTSLVIAGQLGGGLGGGGTSVGSPAHAPVGVTWSTVLQGTTFNPPQQSGRVQSFSTEVLAGATTSLTWTAPLPGTYLLESGTHPSIQGPMGLYGMVVVTCPVGATACGATTTSGTAYPAVAATTTAAAVAAITYNAEIPMLMSEIDPVQNNAVNAAVNSPGFNEMTMKTFGSQVGSINVTSGGSGYTSNPTVTIAAGCTVAPCAGYTAGGTAPNVGQNSTGAGSGATATASVGAVITAITLSSPAFGGTGYTSAPAVTISDTGTPFTAASATAVMNVNAVTAPATTGTGSNYVVGDRVSFTGGGGAGASGTVATVTAGAILTVNITNPGSGYTSLPTAVVGGTGAVLTPVLSGTSVASVTVTTPGSGYVVGDIVTFAAPPTTCTGTCTTATGTVGSVNSIGGILTVSVSNAGAGYTAAPTATAGGTGAALTTTMAISGITVTNGGSGYTAPTVAIAAPTSGTTATAAATIAGTHGAVYSINLSNGGSAYSAPPAVVIAPPGGATTNVTATAVAVLNQACAGGAPCYPSAVNYTPLYYMFNGVAFSKTNASASLFPTIPATGLTAGATPVQTILVRLVNAGLRMHVPSLVGSTTGTANPAGGTPVTLVGGFQLIAEDGNPLPNQAPRVQSEVFMAAGKTYDVMINVPAPPTGATVPAAIPVYDRELSLSANAVDRDGGMLAYISANGAMLPATGAFLPANLSAQANADTYNSVVPCAATATSCTPLVVSDPGKGVIANDINVYGVKVSTAPTKGTLILNADGTFTYTPNPGTTSDSFVYQANGTGPTAMVTLGAATVCPGGTVSTAGACSNITSQNNTFNATMANYIAVKPPGALAGFKDAAGYPLTIDLTTLTGFTGGTGFVACNPTATVPVTTNCVNVDANGGFTLAVGTPDSATAATAGGTFSFSFQAKNSQGSHSATATATVVFPAGSNLQVTVVDGMTHAALAGQDYRWILEEDQTYFIDPVCSTNPPVAGCPTAGGIVPSLGLNFHTSHMPYVALGCTGPQSCEYGQTVVDNGTPCISAGNPAGCSPTAGQHIKAVCDMGNGGCRPDPGNGTASGGGGKTWVFPSQVQLDPSRRYYLSVLPGDAANPFYGATTTGHGQGGANIPALCGPQSVSKIACASATTAQLTYPPLQVLSEPSPYPPGRLAVFVYEDDFPLNGEFDGSGTVSTDTLAIEPGLGGFQIHLWDAMGGNGDFTGQMSYDMFNQPLTNSLDGTVDPLTGMNACPITQAGMLNPGTNTQVFTPAAPGTPTGSKPNVAGLTGMIVTCPRFEADGKTLSPLAGQVVISNLMPGRWGAIATPGADRIARGEEWLQTNTLDGQKAHDVFTRIYEPSYFQEYGPASFHVSIGFANPAIINSRLKFICNGSDPSSPNINPVTGNPVPYNCNNTITGRVVGERLSRTPDERLYGSGSHDAFNWTQCYVSFGDADGEDFAFTKCTADGNFTLTGLPDGDWRITVFDQWNDGLVDGLSTPVRLSAGTNKSAAPTNVGDIATTQWETNVWTYTFADDNRDGIHQSTETGIPFLNVAVRLRDGSLENLLLTDFTGAANFNETFPLFSWYTVETDVTRYKNTGTHVVYDVGGPADKSMFKLPDGSSNTCTPTGAGGYPPCGASTIGQYLANTAETISLPISVAGANNANVSLRVPGAIYCANADCTGKSVNAVTGSGLTGSNISDPPSVCTTNSTTGTVSGVPPGGTTCSTSLSSGRIDPPSVGVEGWQGFPGQNSFIEFGKSPYYEGENGGIKGHVVYASTRPFDDPYMLVQTQWTPLVPHVTMNLYQEGLAADGVTPTLTLVDTTQTSSFDEWAQGFRSDGAPNMNCPGQGASTGAIPDLFYFSLYNQPQYLDWYNSLHGGPAPTALPANSQFKCYDGMHNWNQVQPAPYDGMYGFPSSNSINPTTGKPQATSKTVATISASGNTATVQTSTTHGLISGAQVTIAGAPTGYNSADYAVTVNNVSTPKLFAISVTGPKSFTYNIPSTTIITAAGTGGTVTANATNCTICIADPVPASGSPDADPFRSGQPMLPSGKYVVEVVLPPGYELVKEEDKNILIGDNFISPVTQQFGGLGNLFIIPDQASVASYWNAGYNPFNNQQPTNSFGTHPNNGIVPGFIPEPTWPCVGEQRVVPDYISLFPLSKQVSPFAGAIRRLCDRKEVTLNDGSHSIAKFWIYTSTHIASKFTGGITDDFTSEFDPFSPQFGEKFAPPDLPVSVKDWTGQEISRVYADHWGAYNGMTYSTWEVNPPNPTGYSPTMMIFCMNDRGPILDQRPTIVSLIGGVATTVPNPTLGQMITDPQFTAGYSQFCYELPFMPGTTQYLDTPVVPTSAFAGAGYNNVDCYYPDATPSITEVDGDGVGPWVSAAGNTLTITALGDQLVPNHAYGGPSATAAPFNQKYIKRHYGFGNQTTTVSGGTSGSVTIGGVAATVQSWSDAQIVVKVPSGVPDCAVQQQGIYAQGATSTQCGELAINTATTTSGGQVTGVTITNGGHYTSAPTVTFGAPPGGGAGNTATGTAVLSGSGSITTVTVTNGGTGYTSAPGVSFSGLGTGGTAATTTVTMRRRVVSVTIQDGGGRYPATQMVLATFSGGGGGGGGGNTAATGSVQTTGSVFSVPITSSGSGYTAAVVVVFTNGATGGCTTLPTATANRNGAGGITSITITNPGRGCTAPPPAVTFTGSHTTAATAGTPVLGQSVTGVTLTIPAGCTPAGSPQCTVAGGSYAATATPTVTFSAPTGGGGTRALASAPCSGGGACATTTTEFVSAIAVNNPTTNGPYTSPTVMFTDGGGSGAAATANVGNRAVASVTITNGGHNYVAAPSVTFSCTAAQGCTGGTGAGNPNDARGTATVNPFATFSGQRSIDTVTVTIGGKAPTHVAANASVQAAIDAAMPGDLIIIDPTCPATCAKDVATTTTVGGVSTTTTSNSQSAHSELLVMWKPVRLQGVGAASSVIVADTHPAGKLDAWRARVNCLFGLALNGQPIGATNAYDPTMKYSCNTGQWQNFTPTANNPQVDRLPLEPALGWDINLSGNLAELLQEPSLMGALEGAGITVLSKGVYFPSNPWDPTLLAAFPTGTTLLQNTLTNPNGAQCLNSSGTTNLFPSNFECNPSSIDGLSVTQSSQGGGGIFVHGWGHNIVIANNRIYGNAGTLSGGINMGQGEFAPPAIQNGATNAPPGSCEESPIANIVLPYCENVNTDMHNNWIALNSSIGDELFSATPAGAGGVSICTGSDYYRFQYNWVCGNLSSGDGGGVGHIGFSYNGDIEHNSILFNQSTNPTIPANGGGIIVMGAPDADPTLCINTDADCVPVPGSIGPSDGTGPGLVINANLIMGNSAESGDGGGIAFQAVNGSDMVAFPRESGNWNEVKVTNNIIVDNVAGWDGAGISVYDSLMVDIVNNTIAFNASTASAGPLLTTIGAPRASQPPPVQGDNDGTPPCTSNCGNLSHPQVAGVVAIQNSAVLFANLPVAITCPAGHYQPGTSQTTMTSGTFNLPPTCALISYPKLENNIIYHNASYYIGVGGFSSQFQQNVVSLNNSFAGSPAANQLTTGACVTVDQQYWDIGVRGDTSPTTHSSGFILAPYDSVLSPNYTALGSGNGTGNPNFVKSYCNGSRIPPEACVASGTTGGCGWAVPAGIADATVPNPVFNLTPVATVDEGNNWVNMRWGPLTMTNPSTLGGPNGNYGGGLPLGNYSINTGSSAANRVTGTTTQPYIDAPAYDFFGKLRKPGNVDAGAVEVSDSASTNQFQLSPAIVDFGLIPVHSSTTLDQDVLVINGDNVALAISSIVINCATIPGGGGGGGGTCNTGSFSLKPDTVATPNDATNVPNCVVGATLAVGEACVVPVVFNPTSTSHAVRNASLSVTAGGATQVVALTGHDTFGTLYVAPPGTTPAPGDNNVTVTGTQTTTPTMTPATPSTVAITGTITLTNTQSICLAAPCVNGSSVDAGPITPSQITLTPLTTVGTWALGGTCALGSPINPGGTNVPPDPGSSCTITLTYTPPAGATGPALNGSARLTVLGYGIDPGAVTPGLGTTFINAVYNAN